MMGVGLKFCVTLAGVSNDSLTVYNTTADPSVKKKKKSLSAVKCRYRKDGRVIGNNTGWKDGCRERVSGYQPKGVLKSMKPQQKR
jgi:hypothetical protein